MTIKEFAEVLTKACKGELRCPTYGHCPFKYRGGLHGIYQILEFAHHHETGEVFVIYRQMSEPRNVYARPINEFMAEVDKEKHPNTKQRYVFEAWNG